jgi:hypothetical protein
MMAMYLLLRKIRRLKQHIKASSFALDLELICHAVANFPKLTAGV